MTDADLQIVRERLHSTSFALRMSLAHVVYQRASLHCEEIRTKDQNGRTIRLTRLWSTRARPRVEIEGLWCHPRPDLSTGDYFSRLTAACVAARFQHNPNLPLFIADLAGHLAGTIRPLAALHRIDIILAVTIPIPSLSCPPNSTPA